MIVAEITEDHQFTTEFDIPTRVGTTWSLDSINPALITPLTVDDLGKRTNFRCFDDDDVLCYSGWLLNDDECVVQEVVLNWCTRDVGATVIKIHENGAWKQEIG